MDRAETEKGFKKKKGARNKEGLCHLVARSWISRSVYAYRGGFGEGDGCISPFHLIDKRPLHACGESGWNQSRLKEMFAFGTIQIEILDLEIPTIAPPFFFPSRSIRFDIVLEPLSVYMQ